MFVWWLRIATICLCYTQFELNESKQKDAELFDYKSFSNGNQSQNYLNVNTEQSYFLLWNFLIIQHQIQHKIRT